MLSVVEEHAHKPNAQDLIGCELRKRFSFLPESTDRSLGLKVQRLKAQFVKVRQKKTKPDDWLDATWEAVEEGLCACLYSFSFFLLAVSIVATRTRERGAKTVPEHQRIRG